MAIGADLAGWTGVTPAYRGRFFLTKNLQT